MPLDIQKEIMEFQIENDCRENELTVTKLLDQYLLSNGIGGYTASILRILKSAGALKEEI